MRTLLLEDIDTLWYPFFLSPKAQLSSQKFSGEPPQIQTYSIPGSGFMLPLSLLAIKYAFSIPQFPMAHAHSTLL